MIYQIYKLFELVWVGDKFEAQVIYVGITSTDLTERLHGHLSTVKHGGTSKIVNKIRLILASGQAWRLKITSIEQTDDPTRESFWIKYYRERCDTLLNMQPGCGGQNPFCRHGHELTPENSIRDKRKGRQAQITCRECNRLKLERWNAKTVDISKVVVPEINCPKGHPLTKENVYVAKGGRIMCRKCCRFLRKSELEVPQHRRTK